MTWWSGPLVQLPHVYLHLLIPPVANPRWVSSNLLQIISGYLQMYGLVLMAETSLWQAVWATCLFGVPLTVASEKAMAPHSSALAWKIPWTEEPGRLWSMGSLRVGHDWATSLSLFTFTHWRRKWQPTPVFLPGESQGWGSLVGCCLWGRTESDTTEVT